MATCIYCAGEFDHRAGEGDHIFPAALGLFAGFPTFRGACQRCNNEIGKSEEELIRCGPEAYIARITDPPRRRSSNSSNWPAASTSPAPSLFVERHGATLLARPLTRDPRNTETVDQIVIKDNKGKEYKPIKVSKHMTAEDLKARLRELDIDGEYAMQFTVADDRFEWLDGLIKQVWPNNRREDLPTTEVGLHQVKGRVSFSVTDHYWRSLAKMAFHYYLQHNRCGLTGAEPEFAEIRRFIKRGGDPSQFFRSERDMPVEFTNPFRSGSDGVIGPDAWLHTLAAIDYGGSAAVYLHLFVGPNNVQQPYHILLGRSPASATDHRPRSHILTWEPGGDIGVAEQVSMIQFG